MAETSKNKIYYNDDENSVADILADMKKLAESADNAIETKVDKVSGKKLSTNDFTNEYKNKLDELNNYDDTKIKEELEEVKEENTRLKEDLNALPTVQGNGEYVTLDTAECRFKKIHIEGKSEQETRSGKNKFNLNYIEKSAAKVVTDTGVNLTNCWGTQAFNNEKVLKTFKPNTTYTMKAKAKVVSRPSTQGEHLTSTLLLYRAGSSALGLVSVDLIKMKDKETIALNTEKEYVMTFTTPADLSEVRLLTYSFYGNNDGSTTYAPSGEIDLTDIMLVEGTYTMDNFPSYEPYGVSPSPEYPSKIRNVGDNINIFNKNMNVTTTYLNKTVLDTGVRITQTQAGNYKNLPFKIGEDNLLGKKLALSTKMQASANNQPRAVLHFGSPTSTAVQQIGSEQITSGSTIINIPSSFPDGCDRIYLLLYSNGAGTGNAGDYVDYTDLKLEVGDRPTPYSDYNCGNIPIKVQNENLFVTDFDRYMKISVYRICPVVLEKGKKYRLSSKLVGEAMKNITVAIVPFGDVYNDFKLNMFITVGSSGNCVTKEFTVDETWTSPKLAIYDSGEEEFNNIFKNYQIMLEDITTSASSDYIKHQEQTKIFPLAEGQKLMKGDYLAEDGIHYNRKQIILDGTTDGLKVTNVTKHSNDIYYCVVPTAKKGINGVNNLYCSHFKAAFGVEIGQCYVTGAGSGIVFILNDQTITTPKAANDWLAEQKEAGNPVTIEYELATEEIVPYTEEQKQQWEQLKNARSYEGQTHILSTDEISPDFNITARANLSEILNKLQGE